jgi:hypothetical protein
MTTLTIIVSALGGGRYSARLDGRELCQSRIPFLSAARTLQREGVEPSTRLQMIRAGSDVVALRSTVGTAADLTVVDNDRDGPILARYRPFVAAERGEAPRSRPPAAVPVPAATHGAPA